MLYQLVVLIRRHRLSLHLLHANLNWIFNITGFYGSRLSCLSNYNNRTLVCDSRVWSDWSVWLWAYILLNAISKVDIWSDTVILSSKVWGYCSLVWGLTLSYISICSWFGTLLNKLTSRFFLLVVLQSHGFVSFSNCLVLKKILRGKQLLLWRVLRRSHIWIGRFACYSNILRLNILQVISFFLLLE